MSHYGSQGPQFDSSQPKIMADGFQYVSQEQSRQEKMPVAQPSDAVSVSSFGSKVGLLKSKFSRKGKKRDNGEKERAKEQSKLHKSQMRIVG